MKGTASAHFMELAGSKCDDLYTQTILDTGAEATFGSYRSSNRHWFGHYLHHSHGG